MPAGPEYVLVAAEEPYLFVIARLWRGAPGAPPAPQAVYYILEGAVYQAPAVGAVLAARLVREVEGGGGGSARRGGREMRERAAGRVTGTRSPRPLSH